MIPNADLETIAELVESDPVLSGKLIALANSVLLGGGRDKAGDLGSAVMRLGIKMILDLAYTLKLSNMFARLPQFDQLQFWKHTFSVALLSQALAKKVRPFQARAGSELRCWIDARYWDPCVFFI